MTDAVVHLLPSDDGGLTLCCGRTVSELPTRDRACLSPGLATCLGRTVTSVPGWDDSLWVTEANLGELAPDGEYEVVDERRVVSVVDSTVLWTDEIRVRRIG